MNIEALLSLIPEYTAFYTVDELNAIIDCLPEKYPGKLSVSIIGNSRNGDPIRCIKIGNGKHNAICYACPHPNEPIGSVTMLTLASLLAEREELFRDIDFTWYLIPCIDPDGTRLNEGWFKGPFTLLNYARHFYRPPGNKQVEWTFPIDIRGCKFNKPLPETKIIMKLVEELKPRFTFALHNSAYGGAYWYLTENNAGLCKRLENAATRQSIPLHLGEPEAAYVEKYSDAVLSMMSMTAFINYMIKYAGGVPQTGLSCGGCAADYIDTICDCITMLAEVPYFYDGRIADTSESNMTRREAVLENIRLSQENYAVLGKHWSQVHPLFSNDNPFYEFVDSCIEGLEPSNVSKERGAVGLEYERKATVSEVFDNLYGMRVFECLNVALAARACNYELEHPEGKTVSALEVLSLCRDVFDSHLERMCSWMEENTNTESISVRRLVSEQLESALLVAQYITDKE